MNNKIPIGGKSNTKNITRVDKTTQFKHKISIREKGNKKTKKNNLERQVKHKIPSRGKRDCPLCFMSFHVSVKSM